MRILVTGAAGVVGSAVAELLAQAGHEVRATDRQYREDLPVKLIVAELGDRAAAYRLVEGCAAVVQLGNIPRMVRGISPQEIYVSNMTANANIFQAAADVGVSTVVFASSVQAFRGWRTEAAEQSCLSYLPADGSVTGVPANAYGLSKAAGEQMLAFLARQFEQRCFAAVRFPWLISEAWVAKHGAQWLARRAEGRALDELFSYLWLSDAARLIRAIVERPAAGYHALFPAAADNTLGLEPAEVIKRYFRDVPLKKPAAAMRSLVDTSQINDLFRWEPSGRTFRETAGVAI